jgi:hypothetical protein
MEHPGLWDDLWAAGRLEGGMLEIEREAFEAVNRKHFGSLALGTVIHEVLRPVVATIRVATGINLGNCGGCAERELGLNASAKRVALGGG